MNKYLKESHPILNENFIINYISDDLNGQLYSVEASLDSFIPWINFYESLKNKKILIFGTGGGGTAVACALNVENGYVYGVDISEWAIKTTIERAYQYGVKNKMELLHLKNTYPLPYADYYFDIIIMADVIEHITDDRAKYVQNCYNKLKKNGLLVITGCPNLLYSKDRHTTGLCFVPWLSSSQAYRYAKWRKKWQEGNNLDYAGRRGTTYFHIKKWLKAYSHTVLNVDVTNFTSNYLEKNNRITTIKRKILFKPYKFLELILQKIFHIPIIAFMPYINHLFIRKI